MKVLAYIPLHYGADYLKYAIKSVYPVVDSIAILYADAPSHGSLTDLQCPDKKEDLISISINEDPDNKIIWLDGQWRRENEQRNYAHWYAEKHGFDILVAVDSDEIWETQKLAELIELTYIRKASKCLIWMRHLWRSFNYICDDPMRQERIYYIGSGKTDLIYAPHKSNQVWHFGYARKFIDIEYKISIHGHSSEWLMSKDRWFKERYKPFPPVQDVHPVCKDTWNPKSFDKYELPIFLHSHPYFNLSNID